MIALDLTAHGTLRRFLENGRASQRLALPEGTTVAALVAGLGATGQVWIATVNDVVVRFSAPLAADDRVELHGPLEGG
jgi:sulfur carrier protein ThiS